MFGNNMSKLMEEIKLENELVAIGKNITALMVKKKTDTKTVSALTGISISLLNSLKRGEGNPTLGTLITLAKYFGVHINDLVNTDSISRQAAIKLVPLRVLNYAHLDQTVRNSSQNIYLPVNENCDGLFAIKITNSSMLPFFDKGSIFIISTEKKYTDGDIVLLRVSNDQNIFRKIFLIGNHCSFQHISIGAEAHTFRDYKIIGTVTKVIHDLGNINE